MAFPIVPLLCLCGRTINQSICEHPDCIAAAIPTLPPEHISTRPRIVHGPCLRDGEPPDDWWGTQHKHCTGRHYHAAFGTLLCACECHAKKLNDTTGDSTP